MHRIQHKEPVQKYDHKNIVMPLQVQCFTVEWLFYFEDST
jgi:hypothetical protein